MNTLTIILKGITFIVGCSIIGIGIKRAVELKAADKFNREHNNANRFLTGGVWIDNDTGAVYNCCGDRVGYLTYDWQKRASK